MVNNAFLNSGSQKYSDLDILKKQSLSLFKKGIPFEIVKVGSSYSLSSKLYNQKTSFKRMDSADMNFIGKVKRYIIDNDIPYLVLDDVNSHTEIDYIQVNYEHYGLNRVEDLVCIDINSAYWQTALLLGFIDQKLYDEGMRKGKITRLASLGSLAKTREIWSFDGKNFKVKEKIRSIKTESVWFAICKHIGDLMNDVAKQLGSEFFFYWVDGIYIKNTEENIKFVNDFFESKGYKSKQDFVDYIEYSETNFKVKMRGNKPIKTFSYSMTKSKKNNNTMKSLKNLKNDKQV